MKTVFYTIAVLLISGSCKQTPKASINESTALRDGFYEVVKADTSNLNLSTAIEPGQVIVSFDTLFSPGDYTKVIIDTTDFVALKLKTAPMVETQSASKKLLSISLTSEMAQKMKKFSAQRVMKEVVIVLDGKAITMHKMREAITGDKMQITRCDDNGCEYLYTKLKDKKQ